MRESFVKKSSNAFFENKRATVLNEIKNVGGEIITKGMPVIITGKNHRQKTYLDVYFGNVIINGVNPEDLELVKESDNLQPIESDTLDIREHKFY
ncbi:hypothetical protein LNQ49_12880 [Flavobacterium sp. F-65]|uniref:Uncharacterized protein n=1 Tax=Flavobacterium pisciphilum TaxID=2893755 RepID=A0ABS8MV05_9FLAO|nr:hypothetical protein [Flavobacterium sp. F-65]MCC9072478.1 hypothetical protein [Flavobacterium sp. F-65]